MRNQKSTSTCGTYMVAASIDKMISATTVHPKATLEWTVYPGTTSLCCFIRSIQRVAVVAEWYGYRIVACLVTSLSPVPLKTRRVGQRCTLNLSRAEMSSRWTGENKGQHNRPENITYSVGKNHDEGRDFTGVSNRPSHLQSGSVTVLRYQDEILDSIVKLFAAAVGP
ncbi:hypothetical protein TNCV_4586011 [Trichonephila clavipes]|nr:hypothetical protein TNCV_4586011 [Trichonephila clavipes]